MSSCGSLHMDEQRQDDQNEPTYSSSVPIWDVVLKTCWKQWTIGRGDERGSGISVLIVRHVDDDDDDALQEPQIKLTKLTVTKLTETNLTETKLMEIKTWWSVHQWPKQFQSKRKSQRCCKQKKSDSLYYLWFKLSQDQSWNQGDTKWCSQGLLLPASGHVTGIRLGHVYLQEALDHLHCLHS